jgi:3-oxoacid CoA-transferase B subunit
MKLNRSQMVWRAAQDIGDGWLVNLGIGLPVAVADHIPAGREVFFQSENGVIGVGPLASGSQIDTDLVDAGRSRFGPAHPSSIPPGRSH